MGAFTPKHYGGSLEKVSTVLRRQVPGFLPSTSGFAFPNTFPHAPLFTLPLGGISLRLGDAARGVCGGMVFASRDLFEAGTTPPAVTGVPQPASALFNYLVERSFDSFDLPFGPGKYLWWMWRSDRRVPSVIPPPRQTIELEWPRVRREIDSGRLAALGLVRSRSLNPLELGKNHQVLAYGYRLDEANGELAIRVYDPNHPGDDSLELSLNVHAPEAGIRYVRGELPVYGFFRTPFRPAGSSLAGRLLRWVLPRGDTKSRRLLGRRNQ